MRRLPGGSEGIRFRRRLSLSPAHEPRWVPLYVQQIGARFGAMLLADEEPGPSAVERLALFGTTPEEAEQAAKAGLGLSEPVN